MLLCIVGRPRIVILVCIALKKPVLLSSVVLCLSPSSGSDLFRVRMFCSGSELVGWKETADAVMSEWLPGRYTR